ncbi:Trafficking protein particle complex subunit 2 [Camellia lanceoleosa]|uniref:Trafficking protein particle complex subunit 2 n=1 Tax=Camellia lanceoleosa TaxID=1840588 RepID=A0ACC0HXK6_9ERIC|nr:Trafficking protein particle complex subunit 2 [Camellia lanceoleosa]
MISGCCVFSRGWRSVDGVYSAVGVDAWSLPGNGCSSILSSEVAAAWSFFCVAVGVVKHGVFPVWTHSPKIGERPNNNFSSLPYPTKPRRSATQPLQGWCDSNSISVQRYKISVCLYLKKTNMASTACFMIVSRNDIPIYEAEVGAAVKKEEAAHQHQFILHAALDIVQDLAWTTSAMFLKAVDRFNDLVVSVYVTAGHTRLMLLHDSRNDDGIKSFFQEVHELYIKILLNPLYIPGSRITSSCFDTKVRALARKYL